MYAFTTQEYNKLNRNSHAPATLTFWIKYGSSAEPFLRGIEEKNSQPDGLTRSQDIWPLISLLLDGLPRLPVVNKKSYN